MNENIKNYFWGIVAIVLVVVALSAVSYVRTYARSVEPSSFRSFSVQGEGKAVIIPDVAQFTFSVITEGGKDITGLQKENTEKANKAIAFIKSKGVVDKDIKTQHYGVEPRYQYSNCTRPLGSAEGEVCPPPEIVGYTVEQTVLVKARDFTIVGDLLSGVVERGANSVSQLSFTIDDPTEVENEARAEAIARAKAKAENMAEAGRFRIGRLLSIEEGGYIQPVYYGKTFEGGYGGDGAAPSPSIEPGSEDVRVNVVLRYEIR